VSITTKYLCAQRHYGNSGWNSLAEPSRGTEARQTKRSGARQGEGREAGGPNQRDYTPGLGAKSVVLRRSYLWGQDLSGSLQGAGGVGGLIAIFKHTPGTHAVEAHFLSYDSNGNITALTAAATGQISAQYEYDAFGNTLRTEGPFALENPFRFSTKYTEGITGLYYYGYRWYDPVHGRWLSRDPIAERGGINLYGMAENDAVNSFDVLGLEGQFPWREEPATNNIVNCAGHATGCNHALEPDKDKSFNDVMKKKGYKCSKGVSALECKSKCGEECVELYFYKPKDANPDAKYPKNPIKSKGESFGPGKDMDYHALRGIPGGGYDYQPEAAIKRSPQDKTGNPPQFNPTPERPDYFKPEQIVEKYCCCKKK
jgi:RHS repeat-associated protein